MLAFVDILCKSNQCSRTWGGSSSVHTKLEPAKSRSNEMLNIYVLKNFIPHTLFIIIYTKRKKLIAYFSSKREIDKAKFILDGPRQVREASSEDLQITKFITKRQSLGVFQFIIPSDECTLPLFEVFWNSN